MQTLKQFRVDAALDKLATKERLPTKLRKGGMVLILQRKEVESYKNITLARIAKDSSSNLAQVHLLTTAGRHNTAKDLCKERFLNLYVTKGGKPSREKNGGNKPCERTIHRMEIVTKTGVFKMRTNGRLPRSVQVVIMELAEALR